MLFKQFAVFAAAIRSAGTSLFVTMYHVAKASNHEDARIEDSPSRVSFSMSFMRLAAAAASILLFAMAGIQASITVNCARHEGPILHCANGFLLGMGTSTPADTFISYLKPTMLRQGCWTGRSQPGGLETYDRAKRLGVDHVEVFLCDAVSYRQPGTASLSWDSYLTTITNYVNQSVAQKRPLWWDLWNEPDWGDFWSGTWEQWLEVWRRSYGAVRAADPAGIIVGPSTAEPSGGIGRITAFLDYAAANNCMPDVVCWHLNTSGYWITDAHKIESDAHLIRLQLDRLGYDTTKVPLSSNEYGDAGYATNAGGCVEYFAQMERARFIDGAKACWGTCDGQSLDGIVNGSTPNQVWWAYRRYAEMHGERHNVTITDNNIDGIAAFDSTAQKLNILLGSHARSTSTVALRIVNCYGVSGSLPVKIEKMASPPQIVSSSNVTIAGDSLRIDIPNFGGTNAFLISISNFTYRNNPVTILQGAPAVAKVAGMRVLANALAVAGEGEIIVQIANARGQVVHFGRFVGAGRVNLGDLAPGVYQMLVRASHGAQTMRIVR
jgi:hypothetical protein